MMSVVNGSSASSSSSHVGSQPTTTTNHISNTNSMPPQNGSAAASENKPKARSRRPKKSSSTRDADAASSKVNTNGATSLSADAPAFQPSHSNGNSAGSTTQPPSQKKKPARKTSKANANGKGGAQPRKSDEEAASVSAAGEEQSDEVEQCLLCADPIKFYAVGECNHTGICSKCFMRMRIIMNDKACPMCKTVLDRVIVSKEERTFDSFQLWGDALGADSFLDEPSEMIFFECRAHYDAMRALREFKCRIKKCREVKHSLNQLKDHLRRDHGAEFCELCLKHQHFFVQEQQIFTKASIKAHNVGRNRSTGPKQQVGKEFHPMCQFCKKRFYGDAELYEHLERDHFKCHICKVEHEYFRNYLSNRYVVFPNDIEYHAHMSSIHGVQNRLLFNFQVARGGENPIGGRAEPVYADDAPEYWNYGAVEPAMTTAQTQLETAFPALPTPSAPAPAPIVPLVVARNPPVTSRPAVSGPAAAAPPRGQIARNQRLAQALGLARPSLANGSTAAFEEEMKTPNYPDHLVEWGKQNTGYLTVVERRLERIVNDAKCHSVSLRFMPPEERALMHELASFYGVPSESFGEDPYRRISFFKKDSARVPHVTLSSFIRGRDQKMSASRLSFLPLRRPDAPGKPGAAPTAAPAPVAPPRPVVRGWEKIEPRRAPVVRDAWSDDEGEGDNSKEDEDQSSSGDDNKAEEETKAQAGSNNVEQNGVRGLEEQFVLTYIEDES
uniref:RING-type E3 ubiquitin transferase n=1 Tax=Globisporangium ultimum (strain ATCC 200006 / CBS 805.95 / DAOM BR144) TaxID=431595 RepID=K3WZB0_GLOUD